MEDKDHEKSKLLLYFYKLVSLFHTYPKIKSMVQILQAFLLSLILVYIFIISFSQENTLGPFSQLENQQKIDYCGSYWK